MVQRDVDEDRDEVIFSEWGLRRQEAEVAEEAAETVVDGEVTPNAIVSASALDLP